MAITDLVPWKKPSDTLAVRRRELDPFVRMRQEIDEMFNNVLGDWTGRMNLFNRGGMGAFMPIVDVTETAKEIRVTAELPGLDEKDLEVSIQEDSLWIKGEKREEHEAERGDIYRSERQYGAFERMIPLPAEVDADKIKASFKKGVLRVTLPKTKEAQSSRRVIQVES
jgi:HSP20 family protein